MKKIIILILTFIVSFQIYSQKDRIEIDGKIIADSLTVENIHIINLTTKQGTISTKDGTFKIFATISDTLFISSLLFKKKNQLVTKQNIKDKIIYINVLSQTNLLNEVVLNNHNLSGNLILDTKNVPEDSIKINPLALDFSFDRRVVLDFDEMDRSKPPDAEALTSPLVPLGNIASISIPDKRYEKERRKRAFIKYNLAFPEKITSDLGIDFFIKKLKIPKEKINHFLTYCEYRGIIELYQQDKKLKVIDILIEESNNYNALKKE